MDELEKDKVETPVETPEEKPTEEPTEEPTDEKEVGKMLGKMLAEQASTIKSEMKVELETFVKELDVNAEKRMSLYNDDAKAKRAKANDSIRAFSKACLAGDVAKLKEMTTTDDASPYAGYAVDGELSAEIRALMTEYGVARREFLSIQLSKNSYKLNELVTDIVVYWVAEASSIKSNQVVLGQNTLELKKLAVIVSMTNELLDDEEIDLFGFVATRVAQAFAREEDEEFFNGDGTTFTGLLQSSDVNTVTMTGTTFASVDADDFIDMVDATPQGALANAKFYLHRSIMSYIRKLKTGDDVYLYQKPSESGPATLWGYPAVMVEAMPKSSETAADTAFVIFGDLKQGALFGYKGAIRVNRFEAGTIADVAETGTINLITSDRQAVRWTERVGYIQIVTTLDIPITVLATASASA